MLDYRNSGDVTGEKDRVVGYTAVAFYAPAPENLAAAERKFLLDLARKTLASVTAGGELARSRGQRRAAEAGGEEGLFRHADQETERCAAASAT